MTVELTPNEIAILRNLIGYELATSSADEGYKLELKEIMQSLLIAR